MKDEGLTWKVKSVDSTALPARTNTYYYQLSTNIVIDFIRFYLNYQ